MATPTASVNNRQKKIVKKSCLLKIFVSPLSAHSLVGKHSIYPRKMLEKSLLSPADIKSRVQAKTGKT